MYKSAQPPEGAPGAGGPQAGAAGDGGAQQEKKKDEGVIDAEYVDVEDKK